MSLYAAREDVADLTRCKRRSSQIAALVAMRVPFRVAPDGWPVVLIADLAPEGSAGKASGRRKEPNYAALEKVT